MAPIAHTYFDQVVIKLVKRMYLNVQKPDKLNG